MEPQESECPIIPGSTPPRPAKNYGLTPFFVFSSKHRKSNLFNVPARRFLSRDYLGSGSHPAEVGAPLSFSVAKPLSFSGVWERACIATVQLREPERRV